MKKIFFPHSFTWLLFLLFLLAFLVTIIVVFVLEILNSPLNADALIFLPIGIIFFAYELFVMVFSYKIHITDTMIYTYGDKFSKLEKVQYKCKISFQDIQDIQIVASPKNSKNKQISYWVASFVHKKFLEFTLTNGKKERICINHYTKKQVLKILNYILIYISQIENVDLNVQKIMQNWYTYDGYKKKKED